MNNPFAKTRSSVESRSASTAPNHSRYIPANANLIQHRIDGPLTIVRGEGVRVFDDRGREYIEALSGLGCVSLGFSETRLIAAAEAQMRQLPYYHGFAGRAAKVAMTLAKELGDWVPVRDAHIFFTSSGSEANDTALKLIRYYNNARGQPQRKKIIALTNAYHGTTTAATSLSGIAHNHEGFDLPMPGILHVTCPHYYRYGQPGESEAAFVDRCVDELERLISTEGPDTIAAFIAEPVMGVAGMIAPPPGYFSKVQAVLRRHGILFHADEVYTGFCRTGQMFASEKFDSPPDLMTLGKALTSAYFPLSALVVSGEIYGPIEAASDRLGVFAHGFTYGGHPVGCAVALEALRIYKDDRILDRVKKRARQFSQGIDALAEHPLAGECRAIGLMGAIEIVADKATKTSFRETHALGKFLLDEAYRQGIITRFTGNALNLVPPLIIGEADLDEVFVRVKGVLDAAWLVRNNFD
ncbi:MAG: aminotransferase [Burkholderiales bacterium]